MGLTYFILFLINGGFMKTTLLLLLTLSSTSLFASDWTLKNDTELSDLMPLALKGKFTSETIYTSVNPTDQVLNIGGSRYFTKSQSASILNENLSYGLNDQLEIGLGLNYILSNDLKLDYGPASGVNGTSDNYKSSGISNPSFAARYRFLSQASNAVNGDLMLSLSPKIGTAKDAVNNVKGNGMRNSTLIFTSFDVGRKYTDMAWRIGVKGSFYGTGKSEDANNSASTTTQDSYSDLSLDGSWQWTWSNKYVLETTLGYGSVADLVNTTSTHVKSNEKKKSYSLVGVNFKYVFSKETYFSFGITDKSLEATNWIVSNTQTLASTTIPVSKTNDTTISLSVKTQF